MDRGRRRRALLFALLAGLCALASAGLASRYRSSAAPDPGPTRPVLVTRGELPAGERIDRRRARRAIAVERIPVRYLPPDVLSAPGEAVGATPHAGVPAGSYLLRSQLETELGRRPRLPAGTRAVEVSVSAGPALSSPASSGPGRVDVLAADEPGSTVDPRVRVLARRVPLLALERRRSGIGDDERPWLATLALRREPAIAVIEADNYARDLRLLPSRPG